MGDQGKNWKSTVKWGLAAEVDVIALEERDGTIPNVDKEVAQALRDKAYFKKQLGNIEVGAPGPLATGADGN